jgi:AcrR family transcriptional regulator
MSRTRVLPPRPSPSGAGTRWKCSPPVQERSRETIDRFAAAAEDLLRTQPFEQVTVQDIVKAAGRPIGSFYARFASKEALLPYLYQRYHEGLEALYATRFRRVDWEGIELEDAVAEVVDLLLGLYTERRWLIRALALFARMHPEALPPDLVEQRRRVFEQPVDALLRHRDRIRHADPASAIRFGVFFVSSVARDKLLFDEAPHARVTPMTRAVLRDELIRALFAYLTSEPPR